MTHPPSSLQCAAHRAKWTICYLQRRRKNSVVFVVVVVVVVGVVVVGGGVGVEVGVVVVFGCALQTECFYQQTTAVNWQRPCAESPGSETPGDSGTPEALEHSQV